MGLYVVQDNVDRGFIPHYKRDPGQTVIEAEWVEVQANGDLVFYPGMETFKAGEWRRVQDTSKKALDHQEAHWAAYEALPGKEAWKDSGNVRGG